MSLKDVDKLPEDNEFKKEWEKWWGEFGFSVAEGVQKLAGYMVFSLKVEEWIQALHKSKIEDTIRELYYTLGKSKNFKEKTSTKPSDPLVTIIITIPVS